MKSIYLFSIYNLIQNKNELTNRLQDLINIANGQPFVFEGDFNSRYTSWSNAMNNINCVYLNSFFISQNVTKLLTLFYLFGQKYKKCY